jgi:hypothetical protein
VIGQYRVESPSCSANHKRQKPKRGRHGC